MKEFDLEDAWRQLEELGDGYYGDSETRRKVWKLREKIYAEEDRQAQEYYNDPESIARDKAMKKSNDEAMKRWREEHGDETCVANPYR